MIITLFPLLVGPGSFFFLLIFVPLFPNNNIRDMLVAETYHDNYCLEIAVGKLKKRKVQFDILIGTQAHHR